MHLITLVPLQRPSTKIKHFLGLS